MQELKVWSVSNKLGNIRRRRPQSRPRRPTAAITRQHLRHLRVITIADTIPDTTAGITPAGTIPATQAITRLITIRSPLHTRSIPRGPTELDQHSRPRVAGHFAVAVAFLMVAVGHFVVAAGMAAGMEEGDRRVPKTGKRNPYLKFCTDMLRCTDKSNGVRLGSPIVNDSVRRWSQPVSATPVRFRRRNSKSLSNQ